MLRPSDFPLIHPPTPGSLMARGRRQGPVAPRVGGDPNLDRRHRRSPAGAEAPVGSRPGVRGPCRVLLGVGGRFTAGDVRSTIPRFTADNRTTNQTLVDHVTELARLKEATPGQTPWPGCWRSSRGSCRSPAPAGSSGSGKTPAAPTWHCPRTRCPTSTLSPPASGSPATATRAAHGPRRTLRSQFTALQHIPDPIIRSRRKI